MTNGNFNQIEFLTFVLKEIYDGDLLVNTYSSHGEWFVCSFAGFNGKLLIVYRQMHQQAPDFFYKSLDKLGLSLVDSLSFTDALTLL